MFSGHIIRSCLVCLALALTGGGVFAQVNAADSAFQRFYAQVTGVGKQTVGFGSGGQLVVGQGVPQISTAGGPVLVDRALPLVNNSGGQITANARVSVPPAVLGRILVRGMGLVSVLGAGVALYDVAQELGYLVSKDSGGELVVSEQVAGACGNPAGCSGYQWSASWAGSVGPTTNPSAGSACPSFVGRSYTAAAGNPFGMQAGETRTVTAASVSGDSCAITYISTRGSCCGGGLTAGRQAVAMPYNPDAIEPSTETALADAIAAKSGWPSGSRVSQAVADATALEPAEPFVAIPEVTGPATSPGTTSTTANPDGSTTTTTTTHNHTYTGPTINTTTQTITSTCTGGSCNTTTTTETPKLDEQPFTMPCGVAGTPPCEVRLDQSGMPPDGGRPFDQASGEVDPERDSLLSKLSEIEEFDLGEWTWTFSLPTGCTPLTMFLGVEVNPCAWQSEIHDIMSVIWILTGIAGAFVIFSRAFQ